ncbi:MAG: MFS transporter [Candidatus Limnocylindrales bacterium]
MEPASATPGIAAPRPHRDDRRAALSVVFGFSLGLGVATVAIPLLALAAGYDAAAIGFLTASAAASQFAMRLALPALLGRFRDRTLIGVSSLLLMAAFTILALTSVLPAFLLAQILQGSARAIFWTSSQTHAIRGRGRPVRRLIDLNVAGNLGTLTGPALGGMLAVIGLPVALAAAAGGTLIAAIGALALVAFPTFDRDRSAGTLDLLRRDGVDTACWASVVGGTWWSMMGSFVPVVLVGAGIGPQGIGWLVTASEAAGMVALLALRDLASARVRQVVTVAAFTAGASLVAIAASPPVVGAYALLLLAGGAASGTVTTLAPAMASLAAGPEEQGDALALSGTFRAGALFGAPALVGGLLSFIALAPALTILAAVALTPGVVLRRRRR